MRLTTTLAILIIFVLAAAGCTSLASTPAGVQCTHERQNCFYFMSNGTAVPCDYTISEICANAQGDYFTYRGGKTYSCASQFYCTGTQVANTELCSREFAYHILANSGQAWDVVNEQQDQNTTQNPATTVFTSTSASTVSTSASIQISVYAAALLGTIFASVRAQINASVTKTVNTVVGNDFTVNVPAGETAYGIYGVKVQVTRGRLYQSNSCGSSRPDYGVVQTYVPISPGWCVWLSGQTPCRVAQES
jgi:hypothetical protein